ncbi:hypothetical protein C8N43_2610 [Litoreibacter ponti]|uniref:Glycosyltransferase 2-like domain-containing protein n=1 Tax=Litoreibacter ponti TaxID=1510457 RepID=A0A2T6BPD9_9RHOB|nr:glycosyltransferase family 2 protein [Litoreibacter ponti]PTX57935.1 hypothetical protein C8N43_2610 [Litoreibacter ponti]
MTHKLGCIIVTYNSEAEIGPCLDSLMHSNGVDLSIVVVDNASSDGTVDRVAQHPSRPTLIRAAINGGFAAGVNQGLDCLRKDQMLDRFWILNPDCTVPPETAAKIARHPKPFSLLGNRLLYAHDPERIQIDAGTINRWTGVTSNLNLGAPALKTPPAKPHRADFISGASMTASREFLEIAGPMPEDYFLYYEEVHWAQLRADLPLAICADAPVLHSAGASIGSATLDRGPSALSVYFKHRARMKFVAWFNPIALPIAYFFGLAKAVQHGIKGQISAVIPTMRALHGLGPGPKVQAQLGQTDQAAAKSRKVAKRLA